jgi:hypothetical protein
MGQFKPMVKMETTEPSVILKLKKGGHVAMNRGGEYGFANMRSKGMGTMSDDRYSAPAAAPKAPSVMARRAAMAAPLMKKGGKAEKHEDAAQDRAMIKKAMAGKKFASGGAIDKFETKTTIKGNAGKYAKTKMHDGDKKDRAHGTGEIKEGKPAGYKTGGSIPAGTNKTVNKGKIVMGGTIEGNEKPYEKTDMHTATKDSASGTGKVNMSNAGGFKRGGKIMHKAAGGSTNWENRPADTAKPGKSNTTTGEVKEANAGGYKRGGSAKKHFATGGQVVNDGKAVKMPRHFVSQPVANSLQSGTFKRGGKVMHKADGGLTDLSRGAYDKSIGPGEDEMEMANAIRNAPSDAMNAVMRLLGKKPSAGAGRGFVNPPMARKSGGRAKC